MHNNNYKRHYLLAGAAAALSLLFLFLALIKSGYLVKTHAQSQDLQSQTTQFWNGAKPFNTPAGQWYPWSSGGPTAAWESPQINRVYICNKGFCWMINRNTLTWDNNGQAFDMSKNPDYAVKPGGDNLPWTQGGPTAAWTWKGANNGLFPDLSATTLIYETVLCNKNYCWRHIKHPTTGAGKWRDDGNAINLPQAGALWKDPKVAGLWSGNGLTTVWTDPLNNKATLCNNTYCWSLNYSNWTWLGQINMNSWPTKGVALTSSWNSPVANLLYLCKEQSCWIFNLASQSWEDVIQPIILHPSPTPTLKPTATPTKKPVATTTPQPTATKAAPTATKAPTCPRGNLGNLNCDPQGCINRTDVDIFKTYFGKAVPQTITTPQSSPDLFKDGSTAIDTADYEILRQNFSEAGSCAVLK